VNKENSAKMPQARKTRSNVISALHFILWAVLSFEIVHFLVLVVKNPSFGLFFQPTKNGEILKIRDFPFLFKFVQKAWLHQTTVSSGVSIYSLNNHLKVISDWAGTKVDGALQFGYSPTMLWVLAPLVPLSDAAAYLIFNVAGLVAIFWMTRPTRCRWGTGLLAFFSGAARYCFVLGQTAMATGAGLLFLAEQARSRGNRKSWRGHWLGGTVLWALTAKPQIALSAAAVLIGLRQWRILLAACMLSVVSTLILWPLLGPHWLSDYIGLLGTFNKTNAGIFNMAFVPAIMANLRSVLSVDIGVRDDVASLISATAWLAALGYITLAGLRSRLPAAALWSMSILSYLLFCPHVSPTEEIQVVVILALCVSLGGNLTRHELFLLVTLPLLAFLSPVPGPFWGTRLPLFLSQLALFFFFAFSGERFSSNDFSEEERTVAESPAAV
jgi:hypothetical protein